MTSRTAGHPAPSLQSNENIEAPSASRQHPASNAAPRIGGGAPIC